MTKETLNYRYIARFTVEAATPLKVGSGEQGLNIDQLIDTDIYGLPIIPGTALTGVLRHSLPANEKWNDIFGSVNGSRLMVSNAHFVNENGKVVEGLWADDELKTEFLAPFKNLPVRQHVRITHHGSADTENHGKYDEQVVFKGARFVFELELLGNENDKENWNTLLLQFSSPEYRIGGGTRKGFGEIEVVQIEEKAFCLDSKDDLLAYLNKTASFNQAFGGVKVKNEITSKSNFTHYQLNIEPEDFFLFSSGADNGITDINPVKEKFVTWQNGKGTFGEEEVLIPASSVKGAIAHRTAFHYNKLTGVFSDEIVDLNAVTGENNLAVKTLFGYSPDDKTKSEGHRGNVILSDVFKPATESKVLNHVSIDRFTGGAIQGALFNEEVVMSDGFILDIYMKKIKNIDPKITEAFEQTLKDICNGMLPLGGGVMRGHGVFTGSLIKTKEEN